MTLDFKCLRIKYVERNRLREFLNKYSQAYLFCYETKTKYGTPTEPHFHAYMETTTQEATLRLNIKALAPREKGGNKTYSLTKLKQTSQQACAYFMKEADYEYHNLSEEFIAECQACMKTQQEEHKEKKKGKTTQLQDLIAIMDKRVEEFSTRLNPTIGEMVVVDAVHSYYEEKGTLFRQFQVDCLIKTLCARYVPGYKEFLRRESFLKHMANPEMRQEEREPYVRFYPSPY